MDNKQILVVDDEEQVRDVLKEAFAVYGYEVLTAESGEEALAMMEKSPVLVAVPGSEFSRHERC